MVRPSSWILGILFFSTVVIGFSSMLVEQATEYGTTLDNETWSNTYDVVGDMADLSGQQQDIANEQDADADNFNPYFKLGAAIRLTSNTVGMVKQMLSHFFQKVFKGDERLFIISSVAIVIIITFLIISALRKYKL